MRRSAGAPDQILSANEDRLALEFDPTQAGLARVGLDQSADPRPRLSLNTDQLNGPTRLAHAGISAKVIMEIADYKHLGTTQRYNEVNDEMNRAAVEVLQLDFNECQFPLAYGDSAH